MENLTNEILEGTEEVAFEAAEEIVKKNPMDFLKAAGKAGVIALAVYGGLKLTTNVIVPFAKRVIGKKGQITESDVIDTELVDVDVE